ncbi:MAG TPA: hypothetical protein VMV95_03825 [Bacillota bacterium]|nr:hypothetical protein [Bacillota bacterium]
MDKLKCFKCSHEWIPRTEDRPLSCPNCKSRNWGIEGYACCQVCKRNFLRICTHHKDGDNKNNDRTNLIQVCQDCHGVIHNGLRNKDRQTSIGVTKSSRSRKYKNEPKTREKLSELRNLWIQSQKERKR